MQIIQRSKGLEIIDNSKPKPLNFVVVYHTTDLCLTDNNNVYLFIVRELIHILGCSFVFPCATSVCILNNV